MIRRAPILRKNLRNISNYVDPSKLKRKVLLLRGAMIRPRVLLYPKVLNIDSYRSSNGNQNNSHNNNNNSSGSKNSHYSFSYTWSELAGHGAFLFLALGYLESDVMNLRMYAASGITMSIIFQYYREKPLWIPIRWNALFLLINGAMILQLLKETSDAYNIPEDQTDIFKNVFQVKGMRLIEFSHLMQIARKREYKKGHKLVKQGGKHSHLYLVISGNLSVKRDDVELAKLGSYRFAGEMAFLRWQSVWSERRKEKSTDYNISKYMIGQESSTTASTTLDSLTHHSESTITSNDNRKNITFADVNTSTTTSSPTEASGSTPTPHSFRINDGSDTSLLIGSADVICEDDCVVYSWRYDELLELLYAQKSLELMFERCLTGDLNKKMLNTTKQSTSSTMKAIKKYELLLNGALLAEEIGMKQKLALEKFRVENNIDDTDHEQLLQKLGWTLEDYKVGHLQHQHQHQHQHQRQLVEELNGKI